MAFHAQAPAPLAPRPSIAREFAFPYRRLAGYAVGACLFLYAALAAVPQ